MKFTTFALSAALAGLSVAQGLSGLPSCAQQCATDSIPKSCGVDVKCICSSNSFIRGVTCCVATACDAEDQEKTIQYADSLCGGAGVSNLPTAASCPSTATAASTATAFTDLPTSSSASGVAGSITSALSSAASSASSAASSVANSISSVVSSASSSAAAASSSAAAASTTTSSDASSATSAASSSASVTSTGSAGNLLIAQGFGAAGLAVVGAVALI